MTTTDGGLRKRREERAVPSSGTLKDSLFWEAAKGAVGEG